MRGRADVGAFVGAREDHQVVFVRNTTEAIDVLAAALQELSATGPRWSYRHLSEHDEYEPVARH